MHHWRMLLLVEMTYMSVKNINQIEYPQEILKEGEILQQLRKCWRIKEHKVVMKYQEMLLVS